MGQARGFTSWIISIGNELLIGRTVNTNASWLGRKLTLLGYVVKRIVVVPDEEGEVVDVFRDALSRGIKVIVSTGGLGPTFDDRTSEFLAKALGREYVVNEEALRMVTEVFRARGVELTEPRLKQAKMPSGSRPIPNPVGTAPGIWIEHGDSVIIALPGVPSEMMAMFEQYVEPRLKEMGPRLAFAEKSIMVKGVPEADLAPLVERAMRIGKRLYIKSHPMGRELGQPLVEIHAYASSEREEEAREEVNVAIRYLVDEIEKRGGVVMAKE